jgi:hypothetical protein
VVFFVVLNADEESIHAAARISAAIDHPFTLDILVMQPSALQASFARKAK